MKSRCLAALLAFSSLTLAHEPEHSAVSVHSPESEEPSVALSSSWESRYYLEGRDVLDGDSILSNTLEMQWESLSLGIWYGNSTEQRYDELHTTLLYHQDFGSGLEGYFGYNHVRFPHGEGHHDHEVHGGLSYAKLPYDLEVALDAYHSIEADGFFAELSASKEWEMAEQLTTSLTAMFGVNQGYVADGHDGANHIALSWGLAYEFTESLSLATHATYNWAIDHKTGAPDDASLKDFFHAGIGVEWGF